VLAPRARRNCAPSAPMAVASARPLSFTVRGRLAAEPHCQFCSIVAKVAWWGPLRVAPWKRPVLLICSLLLGFLCAGVLWNRWVVWGRVDIVLALWGLMMLLCILGVAVSWRGCDSCVARLTGDL
jgi:hypothetical protein